MQAPEQGDLQSAINVTPLVDVVLVLLIIFMVIAPQMQHRSDVELPATERPPSRTEEDRQLVVAIERDGTIRLDRERVEAAGFVERVRREAEADPGRRIVIEGDAALSFGEVKQAMLALDAAGFHDVGLMARRLEAGGRGE